MMRVARAILVYIEAEEAAAAEGANDDDDAGNKAYIHRNFLDCDPNFLYIYTVVTGS